MGSCIYPYDSMKSSETIHELKDNFTYYEKNIFNELTTSTEVYFLKDDIAELHLNISNYLNSFEESYSKNREKEKNSPSFNDSKFSEIKQLICEYIDAVLSKSMSKERIDLSIKNIKNSIKI
jgi:hypothetical protein